MGKKSKAEKKAKREASPKPTKIQKENFKKKLAGLLIGLVGIFLLLFIIFYTVSRVFRPVDFAVMLPKDSTIALMQINVNNGHEQVRRFYNSLGKYELYHPVSIQNKINEFLDVDFENDIKPWLNRQIGVALLEKPDGEDAIDMVFFIESKDIGATKDFMKSRGLQSQEDYLIAEGYKGVDIYRYVLSQSYNFTFINNYLILAENDTILKRIIDAEKSQDTALINKKEYQKVSQNLPITTLVFSYIDTAKMIKHLETNQEFMSVKGPELLAFKPFLKIYKAVGFTVISENKNLVIQTYTMLDGEYLEGRDLLNFESKFRAHYLELIPKNVKFYAGGLNLQKQFHRFSEIFNIGGEVSYLIFEGALRSLKNEYFGAEIDLEEDLYPLLQDEYLLTVNGKGKDQATTIILGLKDPLRDKDKIQVIAESFIRKSAILSPKVVEIELEDGTISEEIQTVPESISKGEEDYKGYLINVLNIGDQPWGVYYLILDDKLVITTKLDAMKASIDLFINSYESFKSSPISRESIQPVLRTSDEVLFFETSYVLDTFVAEKPEWLVEYLVPFKYISVGKNYFKDGISTINYITVE